MASEQTQIPSTVRMAAVQAEGCYFDLPAAVEKTCRFIEEAASKGYDLIAFPELWIPMYPGWIWQRPINFEMVTEYMEKSLRRDDPEMNTICQCAAFNNISVVLSYSENYNHSLYLSQSIIDHNGEIKMHRRKIKPTHAERTIFGDGSGASLMNVVDEPMVGKGEQIHVASFPPQSALWSQCRECAHNLSTTHAIEGNTFLYHIGGGGCACIIAPDGRKLTEDLGEEEEGLLVADLDFNEILKVKAMLDVHGHYSRLDLLWLGIDSREKRQVRPEVGEKLTEA
ncbi:hypothetical protein SI65_00679 [Aspergillus cristatus]|uniref:nitrilase n=1 Tax=Aspergillus cristatus TaxID=573508 RepID=A0A1E3BQ50_ASPCR|nr:hypothetical protein SI65_00679 [Aspergillus cristatus]